jgi:hypothetical protein
MLGLIENSGFGGEHAAPAVRGVYDAYYRKTRHEEPPGAKQIAKKDTEPAPTKPTAAAKPIAAAAQQTAVANR